MLARSYLDIIKDTSLKIPLLTDDALSKPVDKRNAKLEIFESIQRNKDFYATFASDFNYIKTQAELFLKAEKAGATFPELKKHDLAELLERMKSYNLESESLTDLATARAKWTREFELEKAKSESRKAVSVSAPKVAVSVPGTGLYSARSEEYQPLANGVSARQPSFTG